MHPDHDGPEMMRRLNIHEQTPWRTTEKSWRSASAPLLWPQEWRGLNKPPEPARPECKGDDSEDMLSPERAALDGMARSATKINKFYIPINKLPPLGSLKDPRRQIGKGPPSCTPDFSVSRADLLMQRWRSIPSLPTQLPMDHLHMIHEETQRHLPQGQHQDRLGPHQCALHRHGSARHGSARGMSPGSQPPLSRRENTDARLARALREGESARGKTENPHIPCTCCDHHVEKPWMPKKAAEQRVTGSGRVPSSGRAPEPPASGGRPKQHTVSWEEKAESASMASSEGWSDIV